MKTQRDQIRDVVALGTLVRAVRIAQGFRRDELAAATGLSPKFISQVEAGKETAQLGKVLRLLAELGIDLFAETPNTNITQEGFEAALRRRRSPRTKSQA
ncbi:XRE family transcriptional regulator [Caballeronia catudaia]|uniref:XRE family transcriptional regulator n=1 Tax=Caballeronia catudaia TaxID=1777136 RepID=A0A158AJ75_9BURK|nr:helix-turn-helix transcriptional regulator [Caballeronia catudaia]SAK57087.1 XRE family transcriptional regulator [Caballeronia catudaia]